MADIKKPAQDAFSSLMPGELSIDPFLRRPADFEPNIFRRYQPLPKDAPDFRFDPDRKISVPGVLTPGERIQEKFNRLQPQQEQAYLKALGYEVGSLSDTAKNKDQIAEAKRKFAQEKGIDPNDKDAMNRALRKEFQNTEAGRNYIEKTKLAVASGTATKEQIQTTQWIMHGNGREMPNSLRPDGTMDGIAGKETKTAMPAVSAQIRITLAFQKPDTAEPAQLTVKDLEDKIKKLREAGARNDDEPHPEIGTVMENKFAAEQKFQDSLSPEQQKAYNEWRMMPSSYGSKLPWMREFDDPQKQTAKAQAEMEFLKTLNPDQRQKYLDMQAARKAEVDIHTKFGKLDTELKRAQEDLSVRKFEDTLSPEQKAFYGRGKQNSLFGRMPDDPQFLATLSPEQKLLYIDAKKALDDRHDRLNPLIGKVEFGGFLPEQGQQPHRLHGKIQEGYTIGADGRVQLESGAILDTGVNDPKPTPGKLGDFLPGQNVAPVKLHGKAQDGYTIGADGRVQPDLTAQSLMSNADIRALLAKPNLAAQGDIRGGEVKTPSLATPGIGENLGGGTIKVDPFKP